ncbi:HNH endonuclease [Aristaeella lactis]|uniref:HNH endonuclease n=1 Tax=Aristaeella lactis TaxID=3046383 RepID=A0AC61PID1_9FIRM|nr:HNH endonuclease [Aristaeella lactis]QUA53777.1 HNH endonuclease [Aristaeella lactis]SMC39385.1 HNH endonuclease [Aristaeella lactis]
MNRSAEVEAFYVSWKWRRCRKAYAESVGKICEECLKEGVIETGSKENPLETHHKIELTDENINDPNITLNWDNLELLCKKHHDMKRKKKEKRWKIGPDGHVTV